MNIGIKHKFIGIIIIMLIVLAVVMFADVIVPTISSTPIRFDITQPPVNTNLYP